MSMLRFFFKSVIENLNDSDIQNIRMADSKCCAVNLSEGSRDQ